MTPTNNCIKNIDHKKIKITKKSEYIILLLTIGPVYTYVESIP